MADGLKPEGPATTGLGASRVTRSRSSAAGGMRRALPRRRTRRMPAVRNISFFWVAASWASSSFCSRARSRSKA